MSGIPSNDPTNAGFISPVFFDACAITSEDTTVSRVMLGGAVGLVAEQDTLPQLTATVTLKGVALSPQPAVLWEVNSDVCSIDQSGTQQVRTTSFRLASPRSAHKRTAKKGNQMSTVISPEISSYYMSFPTTYNRYAVVQLLQGDEAGMATYLAWVALQSTNATQSPASS